VFSYKGRFWSYHDVAIWPRPLQKPRPPVWIPITGSRESIEWAGRNNIPITPGEGAGGMREDIIRLYAKCLAAAGHKITPDHINIGAVAFVADSKAQAIAEYGPHFLYFNRTLFSHGNVTETEKLRPTGYVSDSSRDYVRAENQRQAQRNRGDFRNMTMDEVIKLAETMPWGSPDEVIEKIVAAAEHAGAGTVLLHLNRGGLPHELFIEQIRRFARDVLPALKKHEVKTVKLAEGVTA
jgi:alkanesulfonate monooxygenase SsuD/methylene tetrahydromethanopterin reductase-like flavin-dependent oxidoreductase (luciferase family)